MKIKFYGKVFVSLVIISLLILPAFIQAEKQKIKVVAENANIRLKPDMDSEIIESPAVGVVFEIEKKVGEWYEIIFPSKVGVLITGYIHEIFVELEIEAEPAPSKFHISLGGLFHLIQAGYDYEYTFIAYEEQARVSDSVESSSAVGFNLGFGFFVIPNVEITGGVDYLSKSLLSNYGYDLPNMYRWDDIAHAVATSEAKFTAMILNFGINYHLLAEGSIRPYVGAGVSYISAKMELLADFELNHIFYSDLTHDIEIIGIYFTEESMNKLGFNFKAGANFAISSKIFVFGEGRYILAKTTVAHPLGSSLAEGEEIDIDLGGASFILGVKLGF